MIIEKWWGPPKYLKKNIILFLGLLGIVVNSQLFTVSINEISGKNQLLVYRIMVSNIYLLCIFFALEI